AAEPGPGSVFPMCLEDGARAGQMAGYRFATPALPLSRAMPADFDGTGAGSAAALGGGLPLSLLALAGTGESADRTREMFAATGAASPPLSFHGSSGQLTIRSNGSAQMAREVVTGDGFVDLMLDGEHHS